jgi:hypothetical protein
MSIKKKEFMKSSEQNITIRNVVADNNAELSTGKMRLTEIFIKQRMTILF